MLGSCQQDCAAAWELHGGQVSPPDPRDWDPAVLAWHLSQCSVGSKGAFWCWGPALSTLVPGDPSPSAETLLPQFHCGIPMEKGSSLTRSLCEQRPCAERCFGSVSGVLQQPGWDVAPVQSRGAGHWEGVLSSVTGAMVGCRVWWCSHKGCPQPFPISLLSELLPPGWLCVC